MATKPPDDPLELAKLQRGRLHYQVKVQNEQIKELQSQVQDADKKRTAYEDVTLIVRRLWDRLSNDIIHLCKQTTDAQADRKTDDLKYKPNLPNDLKCSDPFLLALVSSNKSLGQQAAKVSAQLKEEFSEIEGYLETRANQTLLQLRYLLELIHRQHTAAGQKQDSAASVQDSERSKPDVHVKAAARLRAEVDAQRGLARAATDEATHVVGQLGAERLRCSELDRVLADRDAEILRLRKRILQIQEGQVVAMPSTHGGVDSGKTASVRGATTPPAGSTCADAAQEQLASLNERLDTACTDLAREKCDHESTKRQMADTLAQTGNEGWVHKTKLYVQLTAEAGRVRKENIELTAQCQQQTLERERADMMTKQYQRKVVEAESFDRMHKISEDARVRVEGEKQLLAAELAASEQKVLQEVQSRGNAQTTTEIQECLKTAISESAQLRERLASKRGQHKQGEGEPDLAGALRAQRNAEAEACTLRERLSDREQEAASIQITLDNTVRRQAELHAMVKVLTMITDDPRELVESRANEQVLADEVASLKARLVCIHSTPEATDGAAPMDSDSGGAPRGPTGTANGFVESSAVVQLWKQRAEEARVQRDDTKQREMEVTQQLEQAQQELTDSRTELDNFMKEIEMTGSAFEEMQDQNTRLLGQLAERDETIQALQSNIVKAQRNIKALQDERQSLHALVEQREKERQELMVVLSARESAVADCHATLTAAQAGHAQLQVDFTSLHRDLEAHRAELRQKDAEATALSELVETRRGEICKLERDVAEGAQKRKRMDEEAQALSSSLQRARSTGADNSTVGLLTEQLGNLRNSLYCNICHKNPKSCIINKCYHLFCQECLQQNLSNRNRKCPQCGIAYGSENLHPVFLM